MTDTSDLGRTRKELELKSRSHPEANGRKPEYGDVSWTITVPLEYGGTLTLKVGKKCRDMIFGMLIADCKDNGEEEPA